MEALLCEQLAYALRYKYPELIFHFDYGSGVKLTKGQAVKQARLNGRGYPDLYIAAAHGGYFGQYLELKADGVTVFLRDGSLSASPHLQEQAAMLARLQAEGYRADFAVGFDAAMRLVHEYLALPRTRIATSSTPAIAHP